MSDERATRSFAGLRERLRSVQHQAAAAATAGWNSLSDSSTSTSYFPSFVSANVHPPVGQIGSDFDGKRLNDVNCGANLLSKWQESWKEIHDANESNYEAARMVERFVIGLNGTVKKQQDALHRLNGCLAELPALQNYVHNLTAKIGSMCEDFDIVEAGLFELENTSEVLELQKQMEQQRLALQQHRERRNLDLEKERREATLNHERLVKEHDLRLRQKLRERHLAFEAEFNQEVVYFKEDEDKCEDSSVERDQDQGVEDSPKMTSSDGTKVALEAQGGFEDTEEEADLGVERGDNGEAPESSPANAKVDMVSLTMEGDNGGTLGDDANHKEVFPEP